MLVVNSVITWQNDKKRENMPKNKRKLWNLVVWKPENHNSTRKTAKKI